jgi:hypothetical protein
MRRLICLALVMIAALCMSRFEIADGQEKKQDLKKDSLEALIADGLKNCPDIKVAEEKVRVALAKVRLAEAETEAVRAHLKAKISAAYAEVEAARASEQEGRARMNRADTLLRDKAIAFEEHGAALLTFTKLRNERIVAQERLKMLVGRTIGGTGTPAKN